MATKDVMIEMFHQHGVWPQKRIIMLEGDDDDNGVDYKMAARFIKNFRMLELQSSDPITVIMNTGGGDMDHGLAIYDTIKLSKCHVTVEVTGCALSMGSIILQGADERVMCPNSRIMFHLGTVGGGAESPEEATNAIASEVAVGRRCDNILFDRIREKNSYFTRAKFDKLNKSACYLFVDEAIAMGLADKVKE